jgi:hypothetical protein
MSIATLIADLRRHNRIQAVATEVIDLLQMAAEATDPASRSELLDLAAVSEGELQTLATQVYAPEHVPDFAATSRRLRYAALAERSLCAAGSGESDAAVQAQRDDVPPCEVVLWDALSCTSDRKVRADLYQEMAQLPHHAERKETTRALLEALALQEYHLDPSTPRHPDLVAAEAEEKCVRLSDRAVLATVVATLTVYAVHGPELRFWLVFFVGLALAAGLRFGVHERLAGGGQ